MIRRLRYRYLLALGLAVLAGVSAVFAVAAPVSAQTVAQSYTADSGTQAGMIVQIDDKDGNRVKPATKDHIDAIHGVVVLPNDAPLSLSQATAERQVYVATTGTYRILVSDENGPINKDDFIAVSSIDGVGMQASPLPHVVAGKALSVFDGVHDVVSQSQFTDSMGARRTLHFGYVLASIDVTRNPLVQNTAPYLPGFLQQAAEGVADKPVSPLRVYLSVVVMGVTALIVIVVMATGVRTSVVAMGRNPLARKSILRNLLQVVLIGIIVLIVGLFAVYLLLRL